METQQQIKEIMNNIAHQWRQPLSRINSIVGAIDKILYEKEIHDTRLEEKLQEIEATTKNMSNIMNDFKYYFDTAGTKQVFSLKSLLQNVINSLTKTLNENNITLEQSINCDITYESYEGELRQVVLVLLNNAKDALLERNIYNAKISVELIPSADKYLIKVSDNAGGIAKSVRERMFESHFTTKHKSQGSGIGLYMVRKIIQEKFQGSLSVENIGEGSCFTVALPIKEKNERA